jgi:putative tryptophan/tyrosine transport system substrate-binding protein
VIRTFARPGGNVTGVGTLPVDGKRQELLMEALPGASKIAILADPTFTPPAQLQLLEDAARARGVEPVVLTAGKQAEIAPAMDKAKASGATALNVLSAPLFSAENRSVVIERAAALRLPAIYEWPEMAEEGGLIAYGPGLPLMYRQAARLVVKVLKGAKPQDIPVELPAKFDLIVNLITARALGLTIPEAFLVRADKVIE